MAAVPSSAESALMNDSEEVARRWCERGGWERAEELRREPSWPPMLAAESRRGRWSLEDSMLSARRRVPSWRAKPSSAYETELTLCSRLLVRALCSLIRVVDTATGAGVRLAVLEIALAALSARARARS